MFLFVIILNIVVKYMFTSMMIFWKSVLLVVCSMTLLYTTLSNLNYGQDGMEYIEKTTPETTPETTQKTTQKASDLILSLISKNGTLTRKQLADKTRLTEDGVKWNLNQLRKTGIIRRVGPNKGGHWEIIEKDIDSQSLS